MTAAACPTCKKPADAVFRPFCSKHCADVDLQRWLTGRYVIPASQDDEDDSTPGPAFNDEQD